MYRFYRQWGTGNTVRAIYLVDKNRLGNNDVNQYIQDDDKVLCVQHSGDYFYYYVPLQKQDNGTYRAILDLKFGAYCLSREFMPQIPEKSFHGLLAGLDVNI